MSEHLPKHANLGQDDKALEMAVRKHTQSIHRYRSYI